MQEGEHNWAAVLAHAAAAGFWYRWAAASFLGGYLATAAQGKLLPATPAGTHCLLDTFLLEQTLSPLRQELRGPPDRVCITLQALRQLLDHAAELQIRYRHQKHSGQP